MGRAVCLSVRQVGAVVALSWTSMEQRDCPSRTVIVGTKRMRHRLLTAV
jgi:hypothetical protein